MFANPPDYPTLTILQVANFLQLAPRTISKWIDYGYIPVVREELTQIIKIADLIEFMEKYNMPIPDELTRLRA